MEYCHLTEAERYVIANCHASGMSLRRIALALGRDPATISREYRRNKTKYDGKYRAQKAHEYALRRRRRDRRGSHYSTQELELVEALLRQQWSPQQISWRLRLRGQLRISHETIYRHVRLDRRLGGRLWRELRIVAKFGRKRRGSAATRGRQSGKRHISERPAHVEHRLELGHWEGDTVMGADQRHCVLTLVERKTGYVLIRKLAARTKEQVNQAMQAAIRKLRSWFKTITLDNGTEFHGYEDVERCFRGLKFYFATPYHSWERGTNENTNGLIRQYLPKGSCMSDLTQTECDEIARRLNTRPRKRLNYQTPIEVIQRS
jgi:transposase, IS30 family